MKEQIILTGSCYWCLEAIFKQVRGVLEVESGLYHIDQYAFTFTDKDKLEAIRLTYEPNILSLDTLFEIFYLVHNPTLVKWDKEDCFYPLCRSSVIYYTEEQKEAILKKIATDTANKVYEDPIQTKTGKVISDNFYLAEEKFRDYYVKNPTDGYCTSIIAPKMEKLKTLFKNNISK